MARVLIAEASGTLYKMLEPGLTASGLDAVGVTDISPVETLRLKPAGRAPLTTDHV